MSESSPEYNRPNEGVRVYGTGTDCIGFAQQAASYKDNFCLWDNINRDQTEDASYLDLEGTPRLYPTVYPHPVTNRAYSARIADWKNERDRNLLPLALVVPGDVMYHGTNHFALVGWVNSVQPEDTTMEDVKLIESSWFDKDRQRYAKVTNRTLLNVRFMGLPNTNWNTVRLGAKQ